MEGRGDVCAHVAGPPHCMAGTSMTLQSSYTPVEKDSKQRDAEDRELTGLDGVADTNSPK